MGRIFALFLILAAFDDLALFLLLLWMLHVMGFESHELANCASSLSLTVLRHRERGLYLSA